MIITDYIANTNLMIEAFTFVAAIAVLFLKGGPGEIATPIGLPFPIPNLSTCFNILTKMTIEGSMLNLSDSLPK